VEEQEEKIIYRKLYYKGMAFIKYRGELHRPLSDETGNNHFRLETYYEIKISEIRQISERQFSSKPEVLRLDVTQGMIQARYNKQLYDLKPEVLIITENSPVTHEQVEGSEIHGYFEAVPVIFRLTRKETILVAKPPIGANNETETIINEETSGDISGDSGGTAPEGNKTESDGVETKRPLYEHKSKDTHRITPGGFIGSLVTILVVALLLYFLVSSGAMVSPFLIWLAIILLGVFIGSIIKLLQRFPRITAFIGVVFRLTFTITFSILIINGLIHLPEGADHTEEEELVVDQNRDTVTIENVDPLEDQDEATDGEQADSLLKRIVVRMRWKDLSGTTYRGTYTLLKDDVVSSGNRLEDYSGRWWTNYRDIYSFVSTYDKSRISSLYGMLDSIKTANNLTAYQFAEVAVTMVQSIDYVLIIDGDCNDPKAEPSIVETLRAGVPCLGNAPYGIRTPLQFLSDMKGDCDTRTLVLYTILKHFGYDVVIINSDYYAHSMLGLNLPGVVGSYKTNHAKRYYFWETTAKGFSLGQLPAENGNIRYWYVELNE
jgi:hypothetical protein